MAHAVRAFFYKKASCFRKLWYNIKMKIQKIGHSCLLLKETGQKLLIDPGAWAFAPVGSVRAEEIGPVDVILFTHEHADHFSVGHLKTIIAKGTPRIISHAGIAGLLNKEGIVCEVMKEGETKIGGAFTIEALHAPHGEVLGPIPPNLAYLIDSKPLHPGDSLAFSFTKPLPVLALPIAAPWMRIKECVVLARAIKPVNVIPIHEAIVAEYFRPRLQSMIENALKESGIAFHALTYPQTLEV